MDLRFRLLLFYGLVKSFLFPHGGGQGRCMLGDSVELSALSGGSIDRRMSGHLRIVSE